MIIERQRCERCGRMASLLRYYLIKRSIREDKYIRICALCEENLLKLIKRWFDGETILVEYNENKQDDFNR